MDMTQSLEGPRIKNLALMAIEPHEYVNWVANLMGIFRHDQGEDGAGAFLAPHGSSNKLLAIAIRMGEFQEVTCSNVFG